METDSTAVLLEIARHCDDWIEDLAAQAHVIARRFVRAMYEARVAETNSSRWFRHAVKVRFTRSHGRTLHISWSRMTWYKCRSGVYRYRGKHIKRGRGLRYPPRAFNPVSEAERALIEACENQFARIRRDVEVIGKLRRTIGYGLKAIEKDGGNASVATRF